MFAATVYPEDSGSSLTNGKIELPRETYGQMAMVPGITTVTFFQGDYEEARDKLRDRLALILRSNPWLTGRLVSKVVNVEKQTKIAYLEYSGSLSSLDSFFDPEGEKPNIKPSMSYSELCKLVGGSICEVPRGIDCIDRDIPLLVLSVVPDGDYSFSGSFAVTFSVSHSIIDGYTYYKLLSMLSSDGVISPLNIIPKPDIASKTTAAIGENEKKWSLGWPVLFNVITSIVFGKKPFIENFSLDVNAIEDAKVKVSSSGSSGQSYVSTNDIVVSKFGEACQSRILLMPINFRKRIADFGDDDAGNYEGSLLFGPEDYQEPERIRGTLQSGKQNSNSENMNTSASIVDSDASVNKIVAFRRHTERALPGTWETLRCKIGMVTNWQFPFFSELSIDGCEHIVHIPCSNVKITPFDLGIVYRPRANETALVACVRSAKLDQFTRIMPFTLKKNLV